MEALIAEITDLRVPDLPEYEPDEVMFEDDRNTAFYEVLDAYARTLRCGDLMWQHHFEFLLLGYGAYVTFSEFCKSALPDIPDQHIAQMVAGIDVLLFRPSAELRRLAQARDRQRTSTARSSKGARRRRSTPSSRRARPAARWLEALEEIKDPWFNMATGDGLYHFYRSWYDDPSIPYASVVGHVRALQRGRGGRAADRGDRARARPARGGVRRAARRGRRARRSTSCSGSRARSSPTSRSTSSTATTGS